MRWGSTNWTVVGRFSDGGGIAESEIWADSRTDSGSLQSGRQFSVRARAAHEREPPLRKEFKDALTKDPRGVILRIERESVFYAEQQELLRKIVTTAGWVLAIMMELARHRGGAEYHVQRGREPRA